MFLWFLGVKTIMSHITASTYMQNPSSLNIYVNLIDIIQPHPYIDLPFLLDIQKITSPSTLAVRKGHMTGSGQ